jgi:hypothetical protein
MKTVENETVNDKHEWKREIFILSRFSPVYNVINVNKREKNVFQQRFGVSVID